MIRKGTWVQIHDVLLQPGERAENLPEDTKKTPLQMWDKGFLLQDAEIGDRVEVKTAVGRTVSGFLIVAEPAFHHDFGDFVPEILMIGEILKATLGEVEK